MRKKDCQHQKVSNFEVDYVIEKILDGTYLFVPPGYTDAKDRRCTQCPNLIDPQSRKSLVYSKSAQSEPVFVVPCQRCNCEDRNNFDVTLNQAYKRMVLKGLIDEYPKVVDFKPAIGFGWRVLEFNS